MKGFSSTSPSPAETETCITKIILFDQKPKETKDNSKGIGEEQSNSHKYNYSRWNITAALMGSMGTLRDVWVVAGRRWLSTLPLKLLHLQHIFHLPFRTAACLSLSSLFDLVSPCNRLETHPSFQIFQLWSLNQIINWLVYSSISKWKLEEVIF